MISSRFRFDIIWFLKTEMVLRMVIADHLKYHSFQVCSLEEIGTIIIWTVIQNRSSKKLLPNEDLGLAPWGKVKLIKNTSFTIFSAQRYKF